MPANRRPLRSQPRSLNKRQRSAYKEPHVKIRCQTPVKRQTSKCVHQASALTLAWLATSAHFFCSTRINAANFSVLPPPSSAPYCSIFSCTSAMASTLLTSSFMRCTMAGGILAGPIRPYHTVASNPGKPDSAMVGTLGWPLARFSRVCAMAEKMEQYGAEDGGGSTEKFAAFIRVEQKKWAEVASQARVKADA